ncbi:mechanosensitive ion channel family protein [Mesorhizobium sp. BAC0120]|uniref:mechanosensitive ion channel family protein n=1 Tax=Mesorhizobium sp. BAC0120 TaxID=3090670 RepID=UPI00298BD786|nr:mechanosensitive ion channel family protein [Mesorhizobium sp. BAC0120]MDW6020511.1 mechanosensitive ion channel family protein [Mesorhizobium sp. BAC0120]
MTRFDTVLRRLALILILLVAGLVAPAFAQSADQAAATDGVVAKQRTVVDGLKKQLDDIEAKITAERDDDAKLVEIKLQLDDFSHAVLQSGLAFRPRLSEINNRLEQLGPPPGDGQPAEPDIVAKERSALTAEKAEINAVLGVAEGLSVRVNDLVNRIAVFRRDLFARLLTHRYDLDYVLAGEVLDAYSTESGALRRTIWSWLRFVLQFKLNSLLAAAFFALCAAVPLVGGRRLFGRVIKADPSQDSPSYLSRLSVAFWSTLLPSISVVAFLGATYFSLNFYNVLRGDISKMVIALFYTIALVSFVTNLARAVLAPALPNWRLVAVESGAARWLFWLVAAMAIITGIDYLFSSVYDVMGSPLSLTVAESLIATVLVGVLVMLFGFARPFRNDDGTPRGWPRPAKYAFVALGAVMAVSALLGYVGFAKFLSQQVVITGAILSMMYVGFLTAGAVAEEGALASGAVGRRIQKRFGLDDATLDQLALAASIVLYVLVVLIGVPLILLQWGFQWGDIRSWAYSLATGTRIGNVTISVIGIFAGVVVFLVCYFLTRWFKGWLDESVMARGRVDAGVRNSIRTAVGYAGILLAGLLGISAAGIDLSNIALVAGALSLGIGFGLQNVVSNFVSGLILLVERPFKVGDWVVAGDISGTVKKISVRATEIETFQRQTVIVPNSQFINSSVGNWTHRNKLGRIDLKVGVAYGTDARHAAEVLDGIVRSHPMVLKNPEPAVVFLNFGPAALEFELRFFLADILSSISVQNDIRFAILETFHRERIEIPSAARAVDPRYATPPAASAAPETVPSSKGDAPAEVAVLRSPSAPDKPAPRKRARRPDPDTSDVSLEDAP